MKKSFLRILSIAVTLLLIAGMVMIPVSAAVPEVGVSKSNYNGGGSKATIYRASDAAEIGKTTVDAVFKDSKGNDVNGTISTYDSPWISSDSSVWKFAVGTLGDTFKPSSADFAAPTAEAVKGDGIKLSWTAPVEGKATVKIVGDNYNKEVVTAASSITLGDTEIGKSYQVQVTVGDVSSQILAYNNIYSPITAKNPGNDTNHITVDRFNADGEVTNQWGWTVFNVADYADLIGKNTGFIFRVESIIDPEKTFNFTHYYDCNNQTGIKEWKEYESEEEYINSVDSGIAFNTYLGAMETDAPDDGGEGGNAHKYFIANDNTTRTVYRIDTTGMGINTEVETTNITNGSNMKNNFKSGYIIVPFDVVGQAGLEIIKEYGVFSLTTEAFRYYPENTFETTSSGGTHWIGKEVGSYQYTDIDTEKTGAINVMQDREIFLGDAGFISDFDAFIAACTDITSKETANVDFTKLANVSDTKDTVYLNTLNNVVVQDLDTTLSEKHITTNAVLSDASVTSTYAVSALESITYTTAAGEKMMLGFTAPTAGVYDISCPITADVAKGVYTRVIKETAAGAKSILQTEAAYKGERHLTLITEQLEAGDTVWFEAWANSAATVIDLGIPQMTYLHKPTSENDTIIYNWASYIQSINSADYNTLNVDPVLNVGYFINNFSVDGTEYDYLLKDTYAAATTVKHDMLGLASLSATNDETTVINETDATNLYNALTKHEVGRGGVLKSKYDRYRFRYSDSAFNKNDTCTNGSNISGVTANPTDKSTRELKLHYGFGLAFGGNNKTIYFDSGVYMQFTAPSDGVASVYPSGNNTHAIGGMGVLLHNTDVIATSTDKYYDLITTDIVVKKGDTLTICVDTIDGTSKAISLYDPRVSFTPDKVETASVSYDQAIESILPDAYNVGDTINLPAVAKNGAIFLGWNDGTATYAAGTEYTVNADTNFTAQYAYYGDLDGVDGIAQAADVTVLRKMIMGAADTGASDKAILTGDIDADGKLSLVDLVKIKKMSVNVEVTVGAK